MEEILTSGYSALGIPYAGETLTNCRQYYNALAEQYRGLHQKYEVEDKPVRLGNAFICPACNRQLRQLYTAHCWNCGKRLSWGR